MQNRFDSRIQFTAVYFLMVLLMIADRTMILYHFAFRYTDHDQTLMWYSTKEFMNGRFHEPCFYGQNYSTMMEGLLAVPLVFAGIPYHVALPLLTSVLALLPYFLVSILCMKCKKYFQAFLTILIPLLLPVEYGMLSSMPRGFVTGIFVAGIASLVFFYQNSKVWWFTSGFLGVIALWINPNSVLIVLPVFLFMILNHYRRFSFYILMMLGIIPALGWVFFSSHFYVTHPSYNFYKSLSIIFSYQLLEGSFNNLDRFFNDVTPLFWKTGWLVFLIITIQSLILWKHQNIKAGISLLSGLVLIMLSLGFTKVHEGNLNVFYSLSRMYLAIPVLIALFAGQIIINFPTRWSMLFIGAGLVVFVIKNHELDRVIEKSLSKENDVINFYEYTVIERSCRELNELAERDQVSLIISLNTLYDQMHGCPCLEDHFPTTLITYHERRTWRFDEEEKVVRSNILLIGNQLTDHSLQLLEHRPNIKRLYPQFNWFDSNIYLITGNRLPAPELLKSLGIDTRAY